MKPLDLNKNSSPVRLFFWSLGVLDDFTENSRVHRYHQGTNLCHFVRVIGVYLPLVLLVQLAFWVAAFAVLVYFPVHWFGGVAYSWVLVSLGVVVVAILAVKRVRHWREKRSLVRQRTGDDFVSVAERREASGFTVVFRGWLESVDKKICPSVNFRVEPTNPEAN